MMTAMTARIRRRKGRGRVIRERDLRVKLLRRRGLQLKQLLEGMTGQVVCWVSWGSWVDMKHR
jgi:hypothetical protein